MGAVSNTVSSIGSDIGRAFSPGSQPQPQQVNPQYSAMQQQLAQNAINFGKNLPGYEAQQQNAATDSARQQLAQTMAGVTQNSNARGMLYGSYNQGQQAQAAAQSEANLANTKANINTNAQNTLSNMQGQAIAGGTGLQQAQQTANQTAYQQALANQQSNNQIFGTLLNAVGQGAGLLLGAG